MAGPVPIRLFAASLALALTACGPADGPREIRKTRIVQPIDAAAVAQARTRTPGSGMGSGMGNFAAPPTSQGAPASSSGASQVHYELPEGWVELPNSSMRAANFTLEADKQVECYLTLLPGTAGGMGANVNRWRKQMGLPDLSADEISSMETLDFMGGRAAWMDVVGTWSGMSGGSGESGWRMLGLLLVTPGGSSFLKMVGPDELVASEREHFLELAATMHSGAGHSHGEAPTAGATSTPSGMSGLGSGLTGMGSGKPGDPPPPPRSVAAGMSWQAPAAWAEAPERQFRNANYFAGSEDVEAYVTVLPGDAGGPLANVNRWRSQMGQPPLSMGGFDLLERVPMLGSSGVLVEIKGSFQSMSGDVTSDAMMIGALGQIPGRSIFVKMIGPAEQVLAQRGAFLEFCNSLEIVSGS